MSVGTSQAWRNPLRCRDARNIFKSLNSWIVNYFDCVWSLKQFLALKVQMKTLKYNFHMFAVGYIALQCVKFSFILRKTTQYVRISIILLLSETVYFGFECFAISKPSLFFWKYNIKHLSVITQLGSCMRGNKRGIICSFVIDIKTKKIQQLWSTDPFSFIQPVHAFFFFPK